MTSQRLSMVRWLGCIAILWFGWALQARAAKPAPEWEIGPKPSWVQPIAPPADPGYAASHPNGGAAYETIDRQRRLVDGEDWSYGHIVVRIVSEAGAQAVGQQSFEFSPPNERLILHSIQVRRGDAVVSQLEADRVQLLQREANLEQQVYDNRRTAFILIPDLRVGDILEYDWSIVGGNPVLDGHVAATLAVRESAHIGVLRTRIVSDHELQVRSHGGAPLPTLTRLDGNYEYTLRADSVAPTEVVSGLPAEDPVVPWVQLSDFADWGATARWGEALFSDPELPEALGPVVSKIESDHPTDAGRVVAVLAWVQSEIRYFSLPFAQSTHRPTVPQTVLERRFGDCKDKALLMVGLLRELGISASVALVDTTQGRFLPELLPTSSGFDHAIVMANVDGRTVWLDPTSSSQRGSLDDVAARGFHWALPLAPGADALVRVTEPPLDWPQVRVNSRYRSTSFTEPATLDVETVYAGGWAEGMRYLRHGNDPEAFATTVEFAQRKVHPDAEPLGELEYAEDAARNLVTIKRSYRLPSFWTEDSGRFETIVSPYALFEVTETAEPGREHPLAISFPSAVEHHIVLSLHTEFQVEPAHSQRDDGGIRFEYQARAEGTEVSLDWSFSTTTHRVEVAELGEYRTAVAAMDETMSFQLWDQSDLFEGDHTFNWSMFAIAVLWGVLLTVGAALVIWKQPYIPRRAVRYDPNLVGLGGWLALVGLGLVFAPFMIVFDAWETLPSYSNELWAAYTVPGGSYYDAIWAPVLLFELFANILLFVVTVLAVVTYFSKSRSFPLVFVARQALTLLVIVVDSGLCTLLPDPQPFMEASETGALVGAAVWTAYVLVSVRVRSTFLGPPH